MLNAVVHPPVEGERHFHLQTPLLCNAGVVDLPVNDLFSVRSAPRLRQGQQKVVLVPYGHGGTEAYVRVLLLAHTPLTHLSHTALSSLPRIKLLIGSIPANRLLVKGFLAEFPLPHQAVAEEYQRIEKLLVSRCLQLQPVTQLTHSVSVVLNSRVFQYFDRSRYRIRCN